MFSPNNFNHDGVSFNPDDVIKAMPSFENHNNDILQNLANSIEDMDRHKYEARQAQIDAAEDIAVIRENTTSIIENQKHLIDSQKEIINTQMVIIEQLNSLNDTQKKQLLRLKEIFYSVEDGTSVNKEVMVELEKLIEHQPGWKDFIKDKGADLVVGGILSVMPMLLLKLGIIL